MRWALLIVGTVCLCIVSPVLFSSDDLIQQRHRADEYFKEGVFHFNQREYQASSTKFHQALSIEPGHLMVRYWLGKAYYQSGYVRNALLEWQSLLRFKGSDFFLKNKLNRLLFSYFLSGKRLFNKYIAHSNSLVPFPEVLSPTSLFVDKDFHYFITGYTSNNVVVVNKYGELVHEISFVDEQGSPYDVVKNNRGDLFVSDFTNNTVHKFDSQYRLVKKIGSHGILEGQFYGPQGLAFDEFDYLYVVDKGNHRVQKFDYDGNFVLELGKKGEDSQSLLSPTDVCVLDSFIYVSDTDNKRIQVFDAYGEWVKSIGAGQFMKPMGFKVFSENELLVVDEILGLVKITLKPYQFEVIDIRGDKEVRYSDIAFDGNALLYVTNPFYNRVSVYIPEPMKYNNLNVEVLQSSIPNYENKNIIRFLIDWFKGQDGKTPIVTHRVKVEDQFGQPVFGLTQEHFTVYDTDLSFPVSRVKVVSSRDFKKNLKLVILNERSHKMQSHNKRLEEISRGIVSSLNPEDEVEVLNFNHEYFTDQVFTKNRLGVLNALFNSALGIKSREIEVSGGFYHGIMRAYSDEYSQGAIVIFLSGEIDEKSFLTHGYNVCLNFAKNNGIPVYVVAFDDGSSFRGELLDLARSSGGAYYSAYSSNDLKGLVQRIRKFRLGEYYVQYESSFQVASLPQWRNLKIEARLYDVFGQDYSGYYTYRFN